MLELFLAFFLNACINGIIGNRADATAVSIKRKVTNQFQHFQASKIINHDMQKALNRSFQFSLKIICDDCLSRLKHESFQQRGNFELSKQIRWLESKKDSIETELKEIEKSEYKELPSEVLEEIKFLLIQGDPTTDVFPNFKSELIEKAGEIDRAPECYRKCVENNILDLMRDNFAYEIKTNQAVSNIIEGQLLVQTDIKVDMLLSYVQDISRELDYIPDIAQKVASIHSVVQTLPQVLEENFEKIGSELEKGFEKVDIRMKEILNRDSNENFKFFITLDKYLNSPLPRYWPKQKDIENELLYFPDSYLEEIGKKISENGLYMLTGSSGSGKTSLAIAFGLWWRNQINRNAAIFYLDADTKTGGGDWYQEVLTHDYQNEIFIIDNCHLNKENVNYFCSHLEKERPENAFFLLISALKVSKSPWEDEPEDYFYYVGQEAILTLYPESLYKNILKKYSDIYIHTDPLRFVPVEKDFSDTGLDAKLENLCSHNLTVVRSVLEAWKVRGGRLSDVTDEIVLDILSSRYLSRIKKPALVPLCNLGQFEIPIHENFINQEFMKESVKALLKENLIYLVDDELFGSCYKVSFHPQVAALVFRAFIYKNVGSTFKISVDEEIFKSLKSYLSPSPKEHISEGSIPENVSLVYSRLYHIGALDLQRRLLNDVELQNYALKKFATRPLNEVSQYLYSLYEINPDRAKKLLQNFIEQKTIDKLRLEVLELEVPNLFYASLFLTKIDLEISSQLLGKLPIDFFIDRIKFSNLNNIGDLINPSPYSMFAKLGYSLTWQQDIAKILDLNILMEKALEESSNGFLKFLNSFISIDREKAKLFVDKFSPEILGKMFSNKSLPTIQKFLHLIYKLEYDVDYYERITDTFDQKCLINKMEDASLPVVFWTLRSLNQVSPELASNFLKYITPKVLAEKFLKNKGTVYDLNNFLRILDMEFYNEFLRHINNEEIIDIFDRSKLGAIGAFLENNFYTFELPYSIFATQELPNRLEKEKISEISKFVKRVRNIPRKGQQLAVQVLDLLSKKDFTDSVIKSDIEQLSLLLYNSYYVDATCPDKILSALSPSDAVEKSLHHSGIRGIQLLIYNLYMRSPKMAPKMAPKFHPRISQFLQTLDLSERIKEAEIKDLSNFLWGVRVNFGAKLAQKYCRTIDANIQLKQISNSTLLELGDFLWNLVHISDMKELRTLSMPVFKNRLEKGWEDDPCQCIRILGILATVSLKTTTNINLFSFDVESMSDRLILWLEENLNRNSPYRFVLTIKGLQVLDERIATEIIKNVFCKDDNINSYNKIIRGAKANTFDLCSLNILESVDTFVYNQINV